MRYGEGPAATGHPGFAAPGYRAYHTPGFTPETGLADDRLVGVDERLRNVERMVAAIAGTVDEIKACLAPTVEVPEP